MSIKEEFLSIVSDKRALLVSIPFSLLFGFSCTFASYPYDQQLSRCLIFGFLIAIPVLIVFVSALAALKLFGKSRGLLLSESSTPPSKKTLRSVFLILFLALILSWGVYYLVVFPGYCSVDSTDILRMARGIPFEDLHFRYDTINNHHPAMYTFFVWICMSLGSLLGLEEIDCVGLVSFIQMLLFAACCSLGNMKLFELSRSRTFLVASSLFFFLNPLLAMYSISLWKDVLFGGILFVFLVQLAFLLYRSDLFFQEKRINVSLFISFGILAMLFRSNAVPVIALSLLLIVVGMKRLRKQTAVLAASIIIPAILILGPLYSLIGIAPAHFAEAVGIPIQQLSRTVVKDGTLTDGQKEYLDELLPLEEYSQCYLEEGPNGIKFAEHFNDEFLESNKIEFFSTWASVGINNKSTYFEAWIIQTKPFWSSDYITWYITSPGYTLDYEKEKVTDNHLSGVLSSEDLDRLLSIQRYLMAPLFNIAFLCWFMVFVFSVQLIFRIRQGAACLLPLLLLWCTYLLAAPSGDYRYIFPLFLCVPIMLFVLFAKGPSKPKGSPKIVNHPE